MTKTMSVRLFRQSIKSRKWFMYMTTSIGMNIDLELLDAIARHMPTADRMDVMMSLAKLYDQHCSAALGRMDPGQQEVHMVGPLDGLTAHFGVLGDRVYVSDRPFYPYH